MPATGLDLLTPSMFPPAVVAQVRLVAQADTAAPVEGEGGSPGTLAPAGEGETGTSTVAPGTAAPVAPAKPRPSGIFAFLTSGLFPLVLIVVFFYVFMISGNKKKEKARKELINTLARGDKVTTIGGIVATVVDAAGDEVTLKIDENNNTKMRVTRSAVASVKKAGDAA